MNRSSAALAFDKARAAFGACDFNAATAYAAAAENQLGELLSVTSRASAAFPVYSVIILAQRNSPDLENLIAQVKPCISNDLELLVVHNNLKTQQFFQPDGDVTVVNVGFNYGCAGGRNIGARFARGKFLIFLDDDGVLGEGSIDGLIDVIQRYDAIAVRGRILPRTEGNVTPRHYDRGNEITYSAPDTEGMSIWRREEFLRFGGFDSLLAGHEGIALWSKMFRFYGPEAFLYAPLAVLYHDYAKTEDDSTEKKRIRAFNQNYLDHAYPTALALRSMIDKFRGDMRTRILFARSRYTENKLTPPTSRAQPAVSVLTVARNAGHLLDDYTQGLKRQTFAHFEIVFVDQGSNDGTADRLAQLWKGDERLRVLRSSGGRAQSLNLALSEAKNEICVVAEAGDVSLSRRLELTVRHFAVTSSGCLSFAEFSENELFMGAKAPALVRVRTRSLLEPAPFFGALSFRKTRFPVPFDVTLSAGCEAKWLRDNLTSASADGTIIPLHQVYHGRDVAKTDVEREAVRALELAALFSAHKELLGELSEDDRACCRVLAAREALAIDSIPILKTYALRLVTRNMEKDLYDQTELEEGLASRLSQLECDRERMRGDRYQRRLEKLKRKHESEDDGLIAAPEKN